MTTWPASGATAACWSDCWRWPTPPATSRSWRPPGGWATSSWTSPAISGCGGRGRAFQRRLAHGYICWTQNLEGLVGLYRAAGDARYLELSKAIADRVQREPGQHSHGWLTSVRGLLALAEAADDGRYLAQAETAWAELTASENVLPTGTIPEYFAPGIGRDEGCAEADWVRLNLTLYRRTGGEQYLSMAERALFNAFLTNQLGSGDFGHVQLAADGLGHGTARAWWCCTLHGLRAFTAIEREAFHADAETLRYVLPVDSEAKLGELAVRADAELALEARVRFEVLSAPGKPARFEIRRPEWSGPLSADVAAETGPAGLVIERVFRPGEFFTVRYSPLERRDGDRLYLGPWLLAASEAASPAFFDEPHEGNRVLWETLTPGDRPSRLEVDYVPAGYPEQAQRVVLRPLAERFELPDGGRWQWSFRGDQSRIERTADRLIEQSRGRLAPFGAGLAAGAVAAWLWGRRRRARTS